MLKYIKTIFIPVISLFSKVTGHAARKMKLLFFHETVFSNILTKMLPQIRKSF